MILFLISVIHSSMIFASDVRTLDVPVGVDQTISTSSKILKTARHKFIIKSDDYYLRLSNKLINKEIVVAFLPPEYALKAVWTSGALDIIGKSFKHYIYLVNRGGNKDFNKKNIQNKKILLLENSADEFYLKRYLAGTQYQKITGTALDLMNAVSKTHWPDYVVLDSASYFLLKKKIPKISALKIEAGVYYVVTLMRENEIMFNPVTREVFKDHNIPYYDLTKSDLVDLRDLNNSMIKKRLSQKNFEQLFIELIQR